VGPGRRGFSTLVSPRRKLVLAWVGATLAEQEEGNDADHGERADDGADGNTRLGPSGESVRGGRRGGGRNRGRCRGRSAEVFRGNVEARDLEAEVFVFDEGLGGKRGFVSQFRADHKEPRYGNEGSLGWRWLTTSAQA